MSSCLLPSGIRGVEKNPVLTNSPCEVSSGLVAILKALKQKQVIQERLEKELGRKRSLTRDEADNEAMMELRNQEEREFQRARAMHDSKMRKEAAVKWWKMKNDEHVKNYEWRLAHVEELRLRNTENRENSG